MKRTASQTLRKQILIRDLGICQACGFNGDEVHHIYPVYKYPEKEYDITNLILLCYICHRDAPNEPELFKKYLEKGGTKTPLLWGKIFILCEQKNIDFIKNLTKIKEIIKTVKNLCVYTKLEEYHNKLKKIEEIPNFKI